MCGICGYVGTHRPELLEPMCLAMAHRGPDDMGTWHQADDRVGLGHRRLSIIDLSPAGHQPMGNEDGSIWLVYNGELYDFQDFRRDLEARGHRFVGHSDTEVLVHLYEEQGPGFLDSLNGIFALALWDSRRRQLLLARDHAGIKPLYYWQDGERLFFASEIKSLLRIPEIPRRLNRQAIPQYLTFLWVPGDRTMLEDVRKVEPGQSLVWKDGKLQARQWFSMEYQPQAGRSEGDWIEEVHETFVRTTRRQMVSDVPLGAFLSGGLDSSSIVACMRVAFPDRPITCYTARMSAADLTRDQFVDDFPYAQQVAQHLGITLKSFVLEPDVVGLLPKMVYHLDEPDADPAVFPAYMIPRFAREDGVKVLLSGTGGDEVFFGYRSHQAYRQYAPLDYLPRRLIGSALGAAAALSGWAMGASTPIPRRLTKFRRGYVETGLRRHLAIVDWSSPATRLAICSPELLETQDGEQDGMACLEHYAQQFHGSGQINLHSHLLVQTFLAAHNFLYTDKASMATSVEVRVPFMDVELMRLAGRIPERLKLHGRTTKYVLKKAMERHLPASVLYRSKAGFGAPLRKWMAEDLRPVIRHLLARKTLEDRGLFNPAAIAAVIDESTANRADHAYLLYALLTLEIWQQTFIDRPGHEVSLEI
jgi:asparagine synthase (glutamine-hydrolysing)